MFGTRKYGTVCPICKSPISIDWIALLFKLATQTADTLRLIGLSIYHSVFLLVLPCFALFPALRIVVPWNFSNCLRLCIVANLYDAVRAL
jgi:hypothetical protein